MPRKIDFPPLPGTENEQWDELAAEFGMKRDEIKKIVFPSWMFDKGFINKWGVRKMLLNKGYKQIIQPEEDDPEKTYNEWLKEHPFTKKWHETCPYFQEGNPHYEKPREAEIINKQEKINIEDMDYPKPTKKEIEINKEHGEDRFEEAMGDPRDIYITENNRNPDREAVEERIKNQEERLKAKSILKEYAEDRKREEVKHEMEKGLLSDQEEKAIVEKLHLCEQKQEDGPVLQECVSPGDFNGICQDLMTLHARKNNDYGNAAHESFKEFGLISYVIRLNDKMKRLKSLTKPGAEQEVKSESIEDTLMDLAAYAIMAIESLRS